MPHATLRLYAALRRWLTTIGDGPLRWSSEAPEADVLWLVRFKGRDWNGPVDRAAYLCLSEAEAKMVVGNVHGPSPKIASLQFESYLNASYEMLTLQAALADEALCLLLHSRLKDLNAYAVEAYDRATQVYLCQTGGSIQVLLMDQKGLIAPENPREQWPKSLRWKEPQVVWSEEGLAGVMGAEGELLVPCRYSALRQRLAAGRLEALRAPLPDIQEPIEATHFLRFLCDVIDSKTGERVNPPGVSVVRGSLGHDGEFVAVQDAGIGQPGARMGFMNRDGQWLGGCQWANAFLFHEGRAAVQAPDTLCWGYIDKAGAVVITPQYLWPGFFNDHRAVVQTEAQASDGAKAAWHVIDPNGQTITGPWAHIDHAPNDHLVVQALDDVGTNLWSLLDHDGTVLLARAPVPDDDVAFHSDLEPIDKAAQHLTRQWQERRKAIAMGLRSLPLAGRIAQYRPTSQRDLISLGLWGQRVRCSKGVGHHALGTDAEAVGHLEHHYPVTLSIFNLAAEAPVTFTRADGSLLCIGVPWDELMLCESAVSSTRTDLN